MGIVYLPDILCVSAWLLLLYFLWLFKTYFYWLRGTKDTASFFYAGFPKGVFGKSLFNTTLGQKCCLTHRFSKLIKTEFGKVCLSCVLGILLYKDWEWDFMAVVWLALGLLAFPVAGLRKGVASVAEGDSRAGTGFSGVSLVGVNCA